MIYINKMRAQTREAPADKLKEAKTAASDVFDGDRVQDLNISPDIKFTTPVRKSDKKSGFFVSSNEVYVDAVFDYRGPTELKDAYGYLDKIWSRTAPEGDEYQLDFCPARPKLVLLAEDDFPKPMKIKRFPVIRSSAYGVHVGKKEPLDKRRNYKLTLSFVDFFKQKEWETVRKVLSTAGNPEKEQIPASFWWFKLATDRAFVYRDSRTIPVCGYDVPFVDIRLESKQREGGPKDLLTETREIFSGFKEWYFEMTSVRGVKDYVRNSAIAFLQDPKNPNLLGLRQELEAARRREMGLKDLPPIDRFVRDNADLKLIGETMKTSKPGRQSHRLAPFMTIKEGRFIEEEYTERPAEDKSKEIRVLIYYEVLGYDGSFISDEEIVKAFTVGE